MAWSMICDMYWNLMQSGHSMVDIDRMDFMFWLDILINNAREESNNNIEKIDKLGF